MGERFPESEQPTSNTAGVAPSRGGRAAWSRVKILIRRVHLYTGLFLLPWVFLYGITGAMFNHQGLFPEVAIQEVDTSELSGYAFADFPTSEGLAQQVVESLQAAAGDHSISLAQDHGAEFTNPVMFELNEAGVKHVAQIDPLSGSARVLTHPRNEETPVVMLAEVKNINLSPDPQDIVRQSAEQVFATAEVASKKQPQPVGWTKLNFLAQVDGEPARVTYVLKDGHVDVTKYDHQDGMTPRHFFMRMHSTHVQSPHWNGRTYWSFAVDIMAIAMVCWGLSGIFMWWQIKRTRIIGGLVIAVSIGTAIVMYLSLHNFYATTKL